MNYLRRLPKFEYLAPKTVQETLSLLSNYGEKAKLIAGGTDLLPQMKRREVMPQYLISLKNIPGLDYINHNEAGGLKFGPLTKLRAIETSPIVWDRFEPLAQAVYTMGSVQIRNLGTVAGNLCSALPSADTAPTLIILGARLKLVSQGGERVVPVEDFFTGPGETVLSTGELVAEIQVPNVPSHSGGVYIKHTLRRAMDLAIISVAALIALDSAAKSCAEAKIALGVAAPTPMRAFKAEEILRDKDLNNDIIEEAAQAASEEARPRSSRRASAEYRREMIRVLTRRALRQVWGKAKAN